MTVAIITGGPGGPGGPIGPSGPITPYRGGGSIQRKVRDMYVYILQEVQLASLAILLPTYVLEVHISPIHCIYCHKISLVNSSTGLREGGLRILRLTQLPVTLSASVCIP